MLSGSLRPVPGDQFGDLAVTVLTPWHLNPDPGARRLHQQPQLPTSAARQELRPHDVTTAQANPRQASLEGPPLGCPGPWMEVVDRLLLGV